jgi:hypothetical protein
MAEIIGRIATPIQSSQRRSSHRKPSRRKSDATDKNGREYFTFRFAENHGKAGSKNRITTWYDVRAAISRQHAQTLYVGQMVRIRGRLDPEAYLKTELLDDDEFPVPDRWGKVNELLDRVSALATSNVLLTTSVVPCRLPGEELENTGGHKAA